MRNSRYAVAAVSLFGVIVLSACSHRTTVSPEKPPLSRPPSTTVTQPPEHHVAALGKADFQIQGIGVGTPLAEVKKQFGEPTRTDYIDGIGADVLVYEAWGLQISYYRMTGLVTGWSLHENSKMETARGIRVGATSEEVLAAYGASTSSRSDKTHTFYSSPDDAKILLGFDIFNGRARTIAVGGIPFVW